MIFKKLAVGILFGLILSGCSLTHTRSLRLPTQTQRQEVVNQDCERFTANKDYLVHGSTHRHALQVRTGAGSNYDLLYTSKEGEHVRSLEHQVNGLECWVRVQFVQSNITGWIRHFFLTDYNPSLSEEEMIARFCLGSRVGATGYLRDWDNEPNSIIPLFEGIGPNSKIQSSGIQGDAVKILKIGFGSDRMSCWTQVEIIDTGGIGWVRSDFLIFVQ
jgi:hypothetical protein